MTSYEVLAAIGRRGLGVLTAREGTVHLKTTVVALKEVNVNAAMRSVISEVGSISSLKEEQTTSPKAFLYGEDVFSLLLNGIDRPTMSHGLLISLAEASPW